MGARELSGMCFFCALVGVANAPQKVDADARPSAMGPPYTGHFRVSVDTPRGLQPLFPAAPVSVKRLPKELSVVGATNGTAATPSSLNLETSKSLYAGAATATPKTPKREKKEAEVEDMMQGVEDLGEKKESATTEEDKKTTTYSCTTCGVDCTKSRYHCSKHPSIELCPNCYLDGRFPSTLFSGDFLRLEPVSPSNLPGQTAASAWSDQETLLLLEGVELFEDDWARVAEHVGTRTREACILQFLQLPIEDPFLGKPPAPGAPSSTKTTGTNSDLGPLQYNRVPFSPSDNPILTLTAFLAAVVPPKAASAAAEAAIVQLRGAANKTTPAEAVPLLEKAGATALGAAAAKASVLSDNETKELAELTHALVQLQLKKMELKLQHFEELESALELEKQNLEREKQQLYLDRLAFQKTMLSAPGGGVHPGASLMDYANLDGETLLSAPGVVQGEEGSAPEFKVLH